MSISFPSSPTNGQIYTYGARSWEYDSSLGAWKSVSIAYGPQGLQGSTGNSGLQGLQGIQGPSDGATGAQGLIGIQGLQGVQGPIGLSGNDGSDGISTVYTASLPLVLSGTQDIYLQLGGGLTAISGYLSTDGTIPTLAGIETFTNKNLTSATNTFPSSLVTLTDSQTLTNKTLTSPIISTISNTGTLTLPTTTGTLALTSQSFFIGTQSISINQATGTITSLPGVSSVNGATIPSSGTLAINPTTTIGDIIYASATATPGTLSRLAGNTATQTAFLASTGNGTANTTTSFISSTGTAGSNVVLATSPTITTPIIETISASTTSATVNLWSLTLATGIINIGTALTTGTLNLATGGTSATNINIGHTNALVGITGNTTITGTLTSTSTIQGTTATLTGATLNINGASPSIASTNASPASIFTSTVSSVTIGSSAIKTAVYPVGATGTTSGFVTQSAQLAGYLGMPVNAQGSAGVALAYTLQASDAGKMIYVSSTPTTPTITIPANTAVAFEIGTAIVIMNDHGTAATNISIAITTDTMVLAGAGTTGTRTLAQYGVATLTKVTATRWVISGNGLT